VAQPQNPIQLAIALFPGITYILASIAFLYYGLANYCKVNRIKSRTLRAKMRTVILPRLKILTGLCWSCFTIRGSIEIYLNMQPPPPMIWWWLDLLYYGLLEVLPLVLMLLVFRMGNTTTSSTII